MRTHTQPAQSIQPLPSAVRAAATIRGFGVPGFQPIPSLKLREQAQHFGCDLTCDHAVNCLVALYKKLGVYSGVQRDGDGYHIRLSITSTSRIDIRNGGNPKQRASRIIFWN